MIDTHCHLTFPDFAGRVPEVLAEASRHGVAGAITISTTTRDCLEALAIAKRHPTVWCTAGVHPLHTDEGPHEWGNLRLVAADERCVAWGELGLDNHYADPPRAVQDRVLEEQLAFIESCHSARQAPGAHRGISTPADAKAGVRVQQQDSPLATALSASAGTPMPRELPVVIHCREAFGDLIPVLRAARLDPARFVFHCFTGTPEDARKVLDFGAMISFTGVVTYRNAPEVREAARLVPLDRIMVETDAPFLSPEPRRGVRPCSPWMTSLTARRLAEVRGEDWAEFHAAIDRNTERFFGVRAAGPGPSGSRP